MVKAHKSDYLLINNRIAFGVDNRGMLFTGIARSIIYHGYWPELKDIGKQPLGTLLKKKIAKEDYIALVSEHYKNLFSLNPEAKNALMDLNDEIWLYAIVCDSYDFPGTPGFGYQKDAIVKALNQIPGDDPIAVSFGGFEISLENPVILEALEEASKDTVLF